MKSEIELKQIAMDIHNGLIFTDRHIRKGESPSIIYSIFLPLVAMTEQQIKELSENKISMFYEYYSEANKLAINGYPTFMSVRMLNESELNSVNGFIEELKVIKEKFMRNDI